MLNESGLSTDVDRVRDGSDSLSTAHLTERPERDRAEGPHDDHWAERNEQWFGWGEDWDTAA